MPIGVNLSKKPFQISFPASGLEMQLKSGSAARTAFPVGDWERDKSQSLKAC
ncbi:hypothetical protein [Nostoc sp. NZL]|uniref:hypothetical protein n=1 Tax=Nostoc sp. NZL TaxID=2650612 RepID=UPI0018C4E508|nr:hypothetical protein [Nostoc sp. NZL]